MKNKINIYTIIIIIFLYACNNTYHKKQNEITIISESIIDSIYLPLEAGNKSKPYFVQLSHLNKNKIFIELNSKNDFFDGLHVYDYTTNKFITKVDVNKDTETSLYFFKYVNKDSIILIYDKFTVDSSIIIVDIHNNIKSIPNLSSPYLVSNDTVFEDKKNIKTYLEKFVSKPIFFDNKIFFTTYLPYSNKFGTEQFCNRRYPIVGYVDLKKDTVLMNTEIWFPNIGDSVYYPNNAKNVWICLMPNNNILVTFAHTSLMYEWDYRSDEIYKHSIKSHLIDSIHPIETPSDKRFDPENPSYYNIFYNEKQKMYVRYINFPKEKYGNFRNIAVFADKDFNYLGEAYNTFFMIGEKSMVENNGYNSWGFQNDISHWRYSEYRDSIKLVKRKYEFGSLDINKIKNSMLIEIQKAKKKKDNELCKIMGNNDFLLKTYNNKVLLNYLKTIFNIHDSTFAVIIVTDQGCHSCNDYILNFIKYNMHVFNNTKSGLLFAGQNTDLFQEKIEEYNVNDVNLLKIETSEIYKTLNPFDCDNPRLILVRDNKIVKDTLYLPDNIHNMPNDYMDFYDFEAE